MKRLKYIIAALVAAAGLALQAQASLIQYGSGPFTVPSPIGNEDQEAEFVSDLVGVELEACENLDKIELEGENAFWDISWDLTGTGDELLYVLVKDGAAPGGGQLYNLYQVSEDQQVVGSGRVTVNGSKAISHITFLCGDGETTVPDGGATVMLLGSVFAVLGVARRFVSA